MKNNLVKYRVPIFFGSALVLFVLGLMLMENVMTNIQDEMSSPVATTPNHTEPNNLPTGARDVMEEALVLPVRENVSTVRYFYVADADNERQKASMDYFEGVYRPSLGIDFSQEGNPFEVMASLSGTVKEVRTDPLFGKCVTMECADGWTLIYQSMSDLKVKEGDTIEQGSVIGSSGENVYEAELGNHLHFALEKDGTPYDANAHFNKKIKDIQ